MCLRSEEMRRSRIFLSLLYAIMRVQSGRMSVLSSWCFDGMMYVVLDVVLDVGYICVCVVCVVFVVGSVVDNGSIPQCLSKALCMACLEKSLGWYRILKKSCSSLSDIVDVPFIVD